MVWEAYLPSLLCQLPNKVTVVNTNVSWKHIGTHIYPGPKKDQTLKQHTGWAPLTLGTRTLQAILDFTLRIFILKMLSLDCWCNLVRASFRYSHCVFIHRHWRFKAKSTVPNLTSIKLWYVNQFYQRHISKSGVYNSRSIFQGDRLIPFLSPLAGRMWMK